MAKPPPALESLLTELSQIEDQDLRAELGAVVDRLIAEAPAPQKVYGT